MFLSDWAKSVPKHFHADVLGLNRFQHRVVVVVVAVAVVGVKHTQLEGRKPVLLQEAVELLVAVGFLELTVKHALPLLRLLQRFDDSLVYAHAFFGVVPENPRHLVEFDPVLAGVIRVIPGASKIEQRGVQIGERDLARLEGDQQTTE